MENQSSSYKLFQLPFRMASAIENMSLDAAILDALSSEYPIVVRFYGWNEPATTFGYSQKYDWVKQQFKKVDVRRVRRITGGGIVDHRSDLTYALAISAHHPTHREHATRVYNDLHGCIKFCLLAAGIEASLAPCPRNCSPFSKTGDATTEMAISSGICFQRAEPFDVTTPDFKNKIAGAAMKRNRNGLLIQGSVDAGFLSDEKREEFVRRLPDKLAQWLQAALVQTPSLPLPTYQDWKKTFSSSDWNTRR